MLCHNRLICRSLSNAKAFVFSGGFPSVAYLYSPDEVNTPFLDSDVLWLLHNSKNPKNAKRETSPVETLYGTTLIRAGTGLAHIVPSCELEKSVPSTFASWLLGCHLRGRNKERLAQSFPLMSYSAATWPWANPWCKVVEESQETYVQMALNTLGIKVLFYQIGSFVSRILPFGQWLTPPLSQQILTTLWVTMSEIIYF